MKVLIIGNGFDIYHKLPTRYIDFLNVINRLKELKEEAKTCEYLRYMFGTESPLYKNDTFIQECFELHKKCIVGSSINSEKRERLVEIAKSNTWLNLFVKRMNGNIGWIDFENELSIVIRTFENIIQFFTNFTGDDYGVSVDNGISRSDFEILSNFSNIFDVEAEALFIKKKYYKYTMEKGHYLGINKEKIIDELVIELDILIEALSIYIEEFIEKMAINKPSTNKMFRDIDWIVSFNYTKTYQKLYDINIENNYSYIHGQASYSQNNIVLGINSDLGDEIDNMDLAFIRFKKYFQRIQKKTDLNYKALFNGIEKHEFIFCGHSLDKTDGDVIKEIIISENNLKTIILSHDQSAYENHVINLIQLFGKKDFDMLMSKGKLEFSFLDEYEEVECIAN